MKITSAIGGQTMVEASNANPFDQLITKYVELNG